MMEKMIFGRYIPVDSIIHRMDPRAKLIIVFLFIFVVFLANNSITYGILGAFTLIAIFLSNIQLSFIFKGLRFLFWLILFTFLLHIFFTKEGELLVSWGFIKIYEGGVIQGIFISLRFFFLILFTSLLTLTTTPIEITDGLESLLNPLKRFRFPVHELALMLSIALRFIQTLMDETDKIIKAQQARGVDFSEGSLTTRAKAVIPLLIPLFINAFKRADELATAMEARGYRGGEGRTKYRLLKWDLRDTVSLLILVSLSVLLFFIRD